MLLQCQLTPHVSLFLMSLKESFTIVTYLFQQVDLKFRGGGRGGTVWVLPGNLC